jgi:hypothetical protein
VATPLALDPVEPADNGGVGPNELDDTLVQARLRR